MELSIKDNGLTIKELAMVGRSGPMAPSMKVCGLIIWPMVKEDSFIVEVMFMKDNGLMTKLKAKVFTCIRMEPHIQDNGSMTNKMVMAWKNGLMEHSMKAISKMVSNRVMVSSFGAMAVNTKESSRTTILKVLDIICG